MLAVNDIMPKNSTGIGVNIATDLSSMLVEERESLPPGMYIGLCATCTRKPYKKDIAQLSGKIRKNIQFRLALGAAYLFWTHFPPQLFFSPDMKGARRLDHVMRFAPPISVVSNLGAVSADQNGTNARKNSMVPFIRQIGFYMAPQTGCPFVTAVVSWKGCLSINLTYNPDALSDSTAEKIAENIYSRLTSSV
jgi:hypothetical protein